ncbi:hypothetical protein [Burkholderia cepacia]|uniref:hypothetical protein n=1 Tax=Burkholderia cepacia TaxID=292 RepID=UPI00158E7FC2|nr:hypothetical protein [Burkholderia cepacia]MCA8162090.1 hypothetical protein [Burkholderia cepacia]
MTTAPTTNSTNVKPWIDFTFRRPHLTTKSVVRFITHSGRVFQATSLEETIELAEEGLGVSLDYGMEEHGRLERVTLVRSRSGKWLEPKVRLERVWPNTPESQAVRQRLLDVLDAFQNRALGGPCPYDEDGYLPGEREAEAAVAC